MDKTGELLRLVDTLYAAATNSNAWPDVWAQLCILTGSSSAGVLSTSDTPTSQAVFDGLTDAQANALYNAYYGRLDPWLAASRTSGLKLGASTVVGEQLVSRSSLSRSEFYTDFGRRFDIVKPLTVITQRSAREVFALTVVRSEHAPSWDTDDVRCVQLFEPHLQRALSVHSRLQDAEGRASIAEDALDRLKIGVFCLGEKGKVVFANSEARALAERQDGLMLANGMVVATERTAKATLSVLVAKALERLPSGEYEPLHISLPRSSGRPAYRAELIPLRHLKEQTGLTKHARAILFVVDPAANCAKNAIYLRAIFGLTPSEEAIAIGIAQGLSLEEIAAMRQVSLATVRTQLKHIFNKTGTSRQNALASLVSRNQVPLAAP